MKKILLITIGLTLFFPLFTSVEKKETTKETTNVSAAKQQNVFADKPQLITIPPYHLKHSIDKKPDYSGEVQNSRVQVKF